MHSDHCLGTERPFAHVFGGNRKPKYTQQELEAMIRASPDPFDLVQHDLSHLSDGIKGLLDNDHPVLAACAKYVAAGWLLFPMSVWFGESHCLSSCCAARVARYFFELDGGKKIRPTMVLLMSHALGGSATPAQRRLAEITYVPPFSCMCCFIACASRHFSFCVCEQ